MRKMAVGAQAITIRRRKGNVAAGYARVGGAETGMRRARGMRRKGRDVAGWGAEEEEEGERRRARLNAMGAARQGKAGMAMSAAVTSIEPPLALEWTTPDVGSGPTAIIDGRTVLVSGLNGKALEEKERWPTQAEVMATLPKELFKKDTLKSLMYAAISTGLTIGIGLAAHALIPLKAAWTPAWLLYAALNGTVATGAWVVAHECGHGAFSSNRRLQDTVGYILHSALLVPYFAWQRSHAVHHSRCVCACVRECVNVCVCEYV